MSVRFLNRTMIASSVLIIYLTLNLPVFFWHFAGHDDGLFMNGASHVLESGWLGLYNQFTLAKGPTYSVFLALASLSGIPINFVHTAFQLFAVYVTSKVVQKLTDSKTVASITFVILGLSPVTIMPEVRRIIRDQIYWPLSILVFALFVAVLFTPMKTSTRISYALAGGLVFGLTWLTREEGVWLLPGLVILAIGSISAFWNSRSNELRFFWSYSIATIAFFTIVWLFYFANYLTYGSFSGVDFKERNFIRLVNVLESIDVGPIRPFVPISTEARRSAAAAVPSFRPLQLALERGQPLFAWQKASCDAIPSTCGEIGGGWILWALRDAAAQSKFYTSPNEASLKYGEISDGIEAACANGRLQCRARFANFLPPMTKEQWLDFPSAAWKIAKLMIFVDVGRVEKVPVLSSTDINHPLFVERWEMLNRPPVYSDSSEVTVAGWFYDPDRNGKVEFAVYSQDGVGIESHFSQVARPDLAVAFNDANALNDGFIGTFNCPTKCEISAKLNSTTVVAQLSAGNHVSSGDAQFHIDEVTGSTRPISLSTQFSLFILVDLLIPIYRILSPALAFLGICAFFISLINCWRARTIDVALIAATAAYCMVVCRIVVLALVDITSFPATNLLYAMPGSYLILIANILSINSCLTSFRQFRHKVQSTAK